jgi:ATP-binding cassette, subfamily B, multidrug efflux pump
MFGLDGGRRLFDRETSKPKSVRETLGRLLKYFRPFWPLLILVVILVVASTWTQVITPELSGQVVDCYLTPATLTQLRGGQGAQTQAGANLMGNMTSGASTNCKLNYPSLGLTPIPAGSPTSDYVAGLGRLVLMLVGIFVLGSLATGLLFFSMSWIGNHIVKRLRIEVFEQIHRLSLNYYAEHEAGQVMSRVTNDMETISQAFGFILVNVFSGFLLIFWVAFNMLRISVPYALISLAVVPFMWLATNWFSGQARRAFRRTRQQIGAVNANLQESIAGVREVQAFGREDANIETFRNANAANRDANVRASAFTAALAPTLEALGYLAVAITTVVGGIYLLSGQTLGGTVMSLGLIITFLGYTQRFNQPVQQISTLWTNLQSAIAGAERIFGLLDEKPDVTDARDALPMPPIVGRVEFDRVDAAYKVGQPVLCDVSFTAEPGQTVAVVGPTGAGKTTIINLIPRFYDVREGAVRIDGHDVRAVTRESLRSQIGIVLQDTFLFSDTVMNNIRFGRPDATDEEVMAAAQLSHAAEFIQRLPDGYQTLLGERGSGLSLGQRQLLAIARAALADPRILILDEATSSVDTRTERLIQRALEGLLKGRTSFVIAHRLSTIRNADQVLVIENGEIVERGKHDELLAQRGAYYELYMKQFRGQELMLAPGGNGQQPAVQPAPA